MTLQALKVIVCYTAVFSVVTQLSSPLTRWGRTLRDDTKNGCVADYENEKGGLILMMMIMRIKTT